jgi:hypothetical protein
MVYHLKKTKQTNHLSLYLAISGQEFLINLYKLNVYGVGEERNNRIIFVHELFFQFTFGQHLFSTS